jgi:hypothetical protein
MQQQRCSYWLLRLFPTRRVQQAAVLLLQALQLLVHVKRRRCCYAMKTSAALMLQMMQVRPLLHQTQPFIQQAMALQLPRTQLAVQPTQQPQVPAANLQHLINRQGTVLLQAPLQLLRHRQLETQQQQAAAASVGRKTSRLHPTTSTSTGCHTTSSTRSTHSTSGQRLVHFTPPTQQQPVLLLLMVLPPSRAMSMYVLMALPVSSGRSSSPATAVAGWQVASGR